MLDVLDGVAKIESGSDDEDEIAWLQPTTQYPPYMQTPLAQRT